MYYVYILKSNDTDKIYIGQTNNLEKRIRQHNDRNLDKRSYTKLNGRNWKLIYNETLITRKEAVEREKALKSHKGRDWIKETILGR